MGAYQNNGDVTGKKGKSRGKVRNPDRLAAFKSGGGQGSADWSTCDGKWFADVVGRITNMGGAIIFGLSRDQGAHSLTLMLDSSRETLWFNGDEDLNVAMAGVADTLDSMPLP